MTNSYKQGLMDGIQAMYDYQSEMNPEGTVGVDQEELLAKVLQKKLGERTSQWMFKVIVEPTYIGKWSNQADKYGMADRPYVVLVSKKHWDKKKYVCSYHIQSEVKDILPPSIGGETQESIFETSSNDPEVVRTEMLQYGFQEIPDEDWTWG